MASTSIGSRNQGVSNGLGAKSSKRKLLADSDSDPDSDDGGAQLAEPTLKVNEEFARRFEHNKKREEIQRLEEKYNKDSSRRDDGADSSSSDETEDDEGFLATEDLDAQISATLTAIRHKDPRLYDKTTTFYDEEGQGVEAPKEQKEKAVYLRDYQREKILRGDVGASDDEEDAVPTYLQEQDALKKSILSEIDATKAGRDSDDEGDSDGDDFMKRKEPAAVGSKGVHPTRAAAVNAADLDVANADRDPETFLSNFMAARAWVPEGGRRWEAFDSDDGDDDGRADEFEQAYNMRFEDPSKSNEVLRSYARDITAARSVRREEKTGRKRQRELEREQKDDEKRQKKEEKSRLKKLKLEETEGKLRKVRHAAGKVGKELKDEEWMAFLDDAWEDDKWEEEMNKRFGDEYYAIQEAQSASSEDEDGDKGKEKKKPKKPKWDDDIDIKDIVPDFDDESGKPAITLSDSEAGDDDDAAAEGDSDADETSHPSKKRKTTDHKRERRQAQKQARQERAKLEALVDSRLELTHHDLLKPNSSSSAAAGPSSSSNPAVAPFRYRETSPQSFGLTARDILLAPSDQALNQFAGLKKLATFRDEERKRRDRKRLGKKARLREWRRETFGGEFERTGPTYGFERVAGDEGVTLGDARDGGKEEPEQEREKKKKKRSRKGGKGKSEKAAA